MSQTLQILLGILAIIGAIGGFLKWHFSEFNKIKSDFTKLEKEMVALKSRDDLQQQTIDQLNNLYPILHKAIEIINKEKNGQ